MVARELWNKRHVQPSNLDIRLKFAEESRSRVESYKKWWTFKLAGGARAAAAAAVSPKVNMNAVRPSGENSINSLPRHVSPVVSFKDILQNKPAPEPSKLISLEKPSVPVPVPVAAKVEASNPVIQIKRKLKIVLCNNTSHSN